MEKKLLSFVDSMDGNELLNTSTAELVKYLVSQHEFHVPKIHDDHLIVDQREVKIDVSKDPRRHINDRSRPFYVSATSIDIELPFSGDKIAFDIQPTTRNLNNPRAVVGDDIIKFSIIGDTLTGDEVKASIDGMVKSIRQHLIWLENDAKTYNSTLEALAMQAIQQRKEKLLKDRSLVASLGFKLKQRPDAAETFSIPLIRKEIRASVPKPIASRASYVPEPALSDENYEHILRVMENMARVIELSPGAFLEIDEESLRTHFLVQLNGHFMGGATGETFNYEGKTDILVKVDGRNVFIGECKFWTGEKGYVETLDQVLSYLSWRDTKAAVLIFNRNTNLTSVLEKIESSTLTHSNCKKLITRRSETSWAYLFGHKDDVNREISITVQIYNLPDRIGPRVRTLS